MSTCMTCCWLGAALSVCVSYIVSFASKSNPIYSCYILFVFMLMLNLFISSWSVTLVDRGSNIFCHSFYLPVFLLLFCCRRLDSKFPGTRRGLLVVWKVLLNTVTYDYTVGLLWSDTVTWYVVCKHMTVQFSPNLPHLYQKNRFQLCSFTSVGWYTVWVNESTDECGWGRGRGSLFTPNTLPCLIAIRCLELVIVS